MNKQTKDQIIDDYTHGKSTKTALQAVTDRMTEQHNRHIEEDKSFVKSVAKFAITICIIMLIIAAILLIASV